jgi:RimJ/RimL family protein N-acetyltransferase
MTAVVEGELARGSLIVLRAKTMADAEQDYEWRRDPELATFDAARPYNGSLREYINVFSDELSYPSPYRRTVAVEDTEGRHIGNVMYYNIDAQRGEAELGITIGERDCWGRGCGSEAVQLLAEVLFGRLGFVRLHLKTLTWNERAHAAFRKAGFREYGRAQRGPSHFVLMELRAEWPRAGNAAER